MKEAVVIVMVFRLHSFGNSGRFCIIGPANGDLKQSEISTAIRCHLLSAVYLSNTSSSHDRPQSRRKSGDERRARVVG